MDDDIIDCKYAVVNRIGCLVDEFQIDIVGLYFTDAENYLFTANFEFMYKNEKYKIDYNFKEERFRHDLRAFSFDIENKILQLIDSR